MKKSQLEVSYKMITAMILALSLTNCAPKGMSSESLGGDSMNGSLSDGNGDSTNGGGSGGGTTPVQPIDTVDLKGRVEDNSNALGANGILSLDFDKTRGELIVLVPMPSNIFMLPSGSFPQYPDITYGPIADASGKMRMGIRVPLKYIIKGVTMLPPSKLPSGEALPAMPSGVGELPSIGLSFPAHDNMKLSLYIGVNALGVYLELPEKAALPLPFNITLPLKNQSKTKTVGYLTYVTAKGAYAPGLFIATGIPPEIARILEEYFHL